MRVGVMAGVGIASVMLMTGCGAGAHPSSSTAPSAAVSPAGVAAARWWSDSAAAKDSTIRATDPSFAAAKLRPDRATYCSLLSQTQQSIAMIARTYSGQRLQVAVTAFLDELEAVAPGALAQEWRTVGSSMLAVIDSQGRSGKALLPAGMTKNDVNAASKRISADASSECNLTLAAS
jgi:hypothetical protein